MKVLMNVTRKMSIANPKLAPIQSSHRNILVDNQGM